MHFYDQIDTLKTIIDVRKFKASEFRYFLNNDSEKLLATWVMEPYDDHPSFSDFSERPTGHNMCGYMVTSINRTLATKFALGDHMTICENGLSWGEQLSYTRRNTNNALEDVRNGLWDLLDDAHSVHNKQYQDWNRWYNTDFGSRKQSNDFLVMAADSEVIKWQDIPHIREHWLNPEHQEFKPKNLGNMVHAFTSHYRSKNPFNAGAFSTRLRKYVVNYEGSESQNREVRSPDASLN
tara:strand:- start:9952 stop:10662 length:711 start_codon:yes stop_codon:yes gene_type:complete